jgi:hypothetical protein
MSYDRLFMNLSASDIYAIVDVMRWEAILSDSFVYRDYRILNVDDARAILRRIAQDDSQTLDELVRVFIEPCLETRNYPEDYLIEMLEHVLGEDSPFEDGAPPWGARMYVLKKEQPDWLQYDPEPEFDLDALHQAAMAEVRARPRGYVVFEFVTPEALPVRGVRCEVLLGDGTFLTRIADGEGRLLLDNIPQGNVHLRLPDLDESSWHPEAGPAPQPVDSRSTITHVVRKGECLARIAHQYGIRSWRKLWDDPKNEPLRRKRKDPNILLPGDEVVVSGRKVHEIVRATDETHRVIVPETKLCVRVRLHDLCWNPYAQLEYTFGYRHKGVLVERPGSAPTDDDGFIEERIPSDVTAFTVTLHPGKFELSFGVSSLLPALSEDDAAGIRERLTGLGYASDSENAGNARQVPHDALAAFQAHKLGRNEPDGLPDTDTLDALTKAYWA